RGPTSWVLYPAEDATTVDEVQRLEQVRRVVALALAGVHPLRLAEQFKEVAVDVTIGQLRGAEAGRGTAEVLGHAGCLDERIEQRLGWDAAGDGAGEVQFVVAVRPC